MTISSCCEGKYIPYTQWSLKKMGLVDIPNVKRRQFCAVLSFSLPRQRIFHFVLNEKPFVLAACD